MKKLCAILLAVILVLPTAFAQKPDRPWIIAHRGYHVDVKENTVAAFQAAVEAGFKYVEVDVRPTEDGVMVLSHNDEVTMYWHGAPLKVHISYCCYEDLKSYSWDEEGNYPINTFDEFLDAMKPLDVEIICDIKAGENDAVLASIVAAQMEKRCYISFYSTGKALKWVETLNQHPDVGVRIRPLDYMELRLFLAAIPNRVVADINATVIERNDSEKVLLNNALAAKLPIIMSGCTLKNQAIWCGIASGVMANDEQNLSYDAFVQALDWEQQEVTVESGTKEINLAAGTYTLCLVGSSVDALAGSLYAYTVDPSIATVIQSFYGNKAVCTVTGVSPGTTTLRVFTPGGAELEIPVTVEAS